MRTTGLILTLLFTISGCGESKQQKDLIPLESVPESVMAVARQKLPDVKFDRAWKNAAGEFEVSGKARNGKVREIDIKPDGTVVDIE